MTCSWKKDNFVFEIIIIKKDRGFMYDLDLVLVRLSYIYIHGILSTWLCIVLVCMCASFRINARTATNSRGRHVSLCSSMQVINMMQCY